MSTTTRLLAAATLFICSVANADLYTGHIASLEWKTHSSDVVLLVSVDSRSADRPTVKLVSVFSRPGDLVTEAESIADSWKPPVQKENEWPYRKGWRPDGEWLLFVRKWEASEPTIDHVAYLENPLQASWMSSVNARGQLLVDKQAILDVVKSRLSNGDRLTTRQRMARRLVDKGAQPSDNNSDFDTIVKTVEPWLGGFQVPADISIWDMPKDDRTFDEDFLIQSITVPADESYRDSLMAYWTNYVESSGKTPNHLKPDYPIFALINYPGQRTEQLLIRLNAVDHFKFDAKLALEYLRFYEPNFDEQDQKLVGSWVLTMKTERFQLDLLNDHQLIVHRQPVPFPHPSKDEREWFAKGRWNLHQGRLYLMAKSLRLSTMKQFIHQEARLPALDQMAIEEVGSDEITFDTGRLLKRATKPIETVESSGN